MKDREREEAGPSRSAKKRAAKEVEELARALVDLPETEMARAPLAEGIAGEIRQARATRAHGARKRQIKHLAGVLRRHPEELARLQDFLEGRNQVRLEQRDAFHRVEELRDRLCDPDQFAAALEESLRVFPGLDRDSLSRLARAVHTGGDRKAFREIFRQLRKASEQAGEP